MELAIKWEDNPCNICFKESTKGQKMHCCPKCESKMPKYMLKELHSNVVNFAWLRYHAKQEGII